MPSTKYAGYLGGAAVAAGIGAAMAIGGQATAHADGAAEAPKPPTAQSEPEPTGNGAAANPGRGSVRHLGAVTMSRLPERSAGAKELARERITARVANAAAEPDTRVRKLAAAAKKFDPAEVVQGLNQGFGKEPKTERPAVRIAPVLAGRVDLAATAAATALSLRPVPSPAVPVRDGSAGAARSAASGDAIFTNPFRADDPDPTAAEMYGPLREVRDVVLAANPVAALNPLVREGFEAGYRVSQMVPWVNLPIPLLQLATGTHGDQRTTQAAVNQMLLTLPPIGILYYGYDQVADLLNVEAGAAELKSRFYRTIWGIDVVGLLHNSGDSGLPVG